MEIIKEFANKKITTSSVVVADDNKKKMITGVHLYNGNATRNVQLKVGEAIVFQDTLSSQEQVSLSSNLIVPSGTSLDIQITDINLLNIVEHFNKIAPYNSDSYKAFYYVGDNASLRFVSNGTLHIYDQVSNIVFEAINLSSYASSIVTLLQSDPGAIQVHRVNDYLMLFSTKELQTGTWLGCIYDTTRNNQQVTTINSIPIMNEKVFDTSTNASKYETTREIPITSYAMFKRLNKQKFLICCDRPSKDNNNYSGTFRSGTPTNTGTTAYNLVYFHHAALVLDTVSKKAVLLSEEQNSSSTSMANAASIVVLPKSQKLLVEEKVTKNSDSTLRRIHIFNFTTLKRLNEFAVANATNGNSTGYNYSSHYCQLYNFSNNLVGELTKVDNGELKWVVIPAYTDTSYYYGGGVYVNFAENYTHFTAEVCNSSSYHYNSGWTVLGQGSIMEGSSFLDYSTSSYNAHYVKITSPKVNQYKTQYNANDSSGFNSSRFPANTTFLAYNKNTNLLPHKNMFYNNRYAWDLNNQEFIQNYSDFASAKTLVKDQFIKLPTSVTFQMKDGEGNLVEFRSTNGSTYTITLCPKNKIESLGESTTNLYSKTSEEFNYLIRKDCTANASYDAGFIVGQDGFLYFMSFSNVSVNIYKITTTKIITLVTNKSINPANRSMTGSMHYRNSNGWGVTSSNNSYASHMTYINTKELLFTFSIYYNSGNSCYWYPTSMKIVIDSEGEAQATDVREAISGGVYMGTSNSYYNYWAGKAQTFGIIKDGICHLFSFTDHNNNSYQFWHVKYNFKTGEEAKSQYYSINTSYFQYQNVNGNNWYYSPTLKVLAEIHEDGILFSTQGRASSYAYNKVAFSFHDNTFRNIVVYADTDANKQTLFGTSASEGTISRLDLVHQTFYGRNNVDITDFVKANADIEVATSYPDEAGKNENLQIKVDGIEYV